MREPPCWPSCTLNAKSLTVRKMTLEAIQLEPQMDDSLNGTKLRLSQWNHMHFRTSLGKCFLRAGGEVRYDLITYILVASQIFWI